MSMKYQLEVCDTIIPPFQPDLEKKFYKNYYAVDAYSNNPVSGIIADFYQFMTDEQGDYCRAKLLPDACTLLAFNLNPFTIQPFLFTSTQSITQLFLTPNTEYFCVRFYPCIIGNYFHCHSEDFLNRRLYLNEVMPKHDYEQLIHQVCSSNSFEERIEVMTKYIAQKHAAVKDYKNIILSARNMIVKTSGTIDIEALSKQTAYSERYLRKLFLDYIGLSPKALCELIKFQKSFTLYYTNSETLSNIAYICGYYDHSQMNRAYLHLVDYSPTKLRHLLLVN